MSAGRRVPAWAVGLSIVGTYVSSISFLALPSKAFSSDWNPFVFSLALPLTTWAAVRWFVPFYRQSRALSSYEHLEARFGGWARSYAVGCYLLTQLARVGTITYLLALALAPLTGLSVPALIFITGVVVIGYTLYGGMAAVIWTDVVQTIVFIGGAAACVAVLFAGMPGGASQVWSLAAANGKFSLGSASADVGQSTIWVVLLYGIVINLQNFGIDQSYVQRYQTADSDAAARRSVWLGALLYVPISAAFLFIGTGLFAFYTARPDLLPAGMASQPDAVFPHFIATALPAGVAGLVIASVFAAAQSTISSSLNGSATLVLCDVYLRYVRPDAPEGRRLLVLRASTLVFGVAGVGAALAMMRIRSALDAWWQLASIFSGGMLGLFLLGRLSRGARSGNAAAGVAAGVLLIVWMTFSPGWTGVLASWRSPFHPNLIIVIATAAILAVGWLGSAVGTAREDAGAPAKGSIQP
ncbi:MAG: sodium:solute symporter [Acidobacteria bacterium]|nr:sodium:solute symporter [Acidobacteriota bacterium]